MVRFKIKTSPGTLYNGVEDWNLINQKLDSFDYKITDKKAYTFINQTINTKGKDLDFDWNFKSINDSITQVKVGISEKENSVYNRITAPFSNTLFKEMAINLIKDYKKGIEYQLKEKFNVKYAGIDTIPEINYAYIESKNINLRDKAEQMMMNNALLLSFLTEHNLRDGNFPFLIVDNWNLNKNIIDFRFCFPIEQRDTMPTHTNIRFDVLKSKKALKAIYNGNYMTSDRAWFTLHEYAKRHTINIENKPLEIFYNNPHNGGDELKWKAEIFMPIK
jgi:effector-binding domain-containing protein